MKQTDKEESIKCRIGEVTVLTFTKALRIRYFESHDALSHETPDIEKELSDAVSDDIGTASGVLLWSAPVEKRLPIIMRRNSHLVYTPAHYSRYFVTLKGNTFEDYLGKFSSKSRSTLKRKVKKFQQASGGRIDFREFRTPQDFSLFYRDASEISRVSYQQIMFDMGLPDTPDFKRELEKSAETGAVRGYILYLKGTPVAYLYCPFEQGVLIYQYLGYLQEYRHLSPGTVLQMLVFERLFSDDSAEYFDFTQGGAEGGHKNFFATDSTMCADVFVLKPTAANLFFVMSHYGTDMLSQYAGLLLEKLKIKRSVKSVIRIAKGVATRKSTDTAS